MVWATGLALLLLAGGVVAAGPAAASPSAAVSWAGGAIPGPSVSNAGPPPEPASVTVAPAFLPSPDTIAIGAPPPTAMLSVEVGLAPSDPAGLEGLVSALYARGSPQYHDFLSVPALAQRFGPSPSSISSAAAYFQRFGLTVAVSPDHLMLTVRGPSPQVADAFGTSFEEFRSADGTTFFDHPTPAVLPGIAPWSGAYGLGNSSPVLPSVTSAAVPTDSLAPQASCSNSGGPLLPCQVWQAYDAASLIGSGENGSGTRVAIVDPYSSSEPEPELTNDLSLFSAATGVPVGNVSFEYPDAPNGNLNQSTNPDWNVEDALDLQWARASAPGSSVEVVFSPNPGAGLYEAIDWIVAHRAANVISLSWGEPDVGIYNAFNTPCSTACNASTDGSYGILSPVLAFAAAEGISVFAASGDCGASDGTSGVSTNYPASDPDVTGVGGTVLSVTSAGDYISEVAWSGNESGAASPGCTNGGGSGGGYSPFPRPWWQDSATGAATLRGVPDVAADAATGALLYLAGSEASVGGTSLATPIWAGVAAIADQYAGHDLGLLDPTLYSIAAGANYSTDFHDIVSGSNGYEAGVGWDPVTGLGTPIVAALVPNLVHNTVPAQSSLSTFVYGTPRFGRAPLTVTFHANATGGSGEYPLLGISFGDGNASFTAAGDATHTYPTPGVYAVQSYVADSRGNFSVSPPIAVVVGGGTALSVSLVASAPTAAVGAALSFTATATGGTAPYEYNFTFGDGTFLDGSLNASVDHAYGAAGGFCAAVVVSDAGSPIDGGASARVALSVGGAARPDCENDTTPLAISPATGLGVRDAPADFPQLFNVTGGSTATSTLAPSLQFTSTDPYTAACGCAIFRAAGTYEVVGYANDSESQEASAKANVTVAPALRATFTATPTFGTAPLIVRFEANATGGFGATAADTIWSLPNGTSWTGASGAVTFTSAGMYRVIARLSDLGDGNASEMILVDVVAPTSTAPRLAATVTPAVNVTLGSSVNFSATLYDPNGSSAPAQFEWSFGDGSGAFRPSFNWTLSSALPASYARLLDVNLTAVDLSSGAVVGSTFGLPGFESPTSNGFVARADALSLVDTGAPSSGSSPLVWTGVAHATGPGSLSVEWQFGGGIELPDSTVTHTFGSGEFTVVSTASDSFGDLAVDVHPVEVSGAVNVSATLSATSGVAPLTVAYAASATGGVGPPYRFSWAFGGNHSAEGANGAFSFSAPGTYRITLTVNDSDADTATQSWTVVVDPASAAYLPYIFLVVGAVLGTVIAVVVALSNRARKAPPGPPRGATL